MYDQNNVFAKIIRGEIPANKVYEDGQILALHDIEPVAPLHILVIPKGPYEDFARFVTQATQEEVVYFFTKVRELADEYSDGEYRIVTNKGELAGQSVFHFHVHIIGGKRLKGLIG